MTTTAELIAKQRRLKFYERLYIKRRFKSGYESEWLEITKYLLDSSISIERILDFDSFGYGQVKSGSATFELNNIDGDFNGVGELYSLFEFCISRQYTKVLYKAGYLDEDGVQIDETLFQGILNEKTARSNFESGIFVMTALDYSSVFTEQTIVDGSLSSTITASSLIEKIMNNSNLSSIVGYDTSKTSFGNATIFDDAREFESQEVAIVLTSICQKTNSIWYVDSNIDLVISPRTPNANVPHQFIGGALKRNTTNIINIETFDAGFTKIINEVVYDTNTVKFQIRPDIDNTIRNGVQTLNLQGADITTESKINAIGESIISEWKRPRKRVILTTVFSPNIYTFFDLCTIDFSQEVKSYPDKEILVVNQNDLINDDFFIGKKKNKIEIMPNEQYLYFGYSHNVKNGTTKHFLIQKQ